MKKYLLITSLIIISLFCKYQTLSASPVKNKFKNDRVVIDTPQKWSYATMPDKMTSTIAYMATLDATDKLQFSFPYQGGSTSTIILGFDGSDKNSTTSFILSISKGQFNCVGTDGCVINVRFDSNPAIEVKCTTPGDGSTDKLYLAPSKKFLSQLKKAKSMLVSASFYQEGTQIMEFKVDNLNWPHP